MHIYKMRPKSNCTLSHCLQQKIKIENKFLDLKFRLMDIMRQTHFSWR